MTDKNSNAAWNDFWRAENASGGCLPSRAKDIDEAQARIWRDFARTLPRKANILDLATGDGRVMQKLLSERPDLRATGVDLAEKLPPPPSRCRVLTSVDMASLPFPDDKFDAVTSQFGFEYGEVGEAAREIARVLKQDGVAGLMSHRADGSILEHNRARRTQIRWALEEQQLIGKAKASLALRSIGSFAVPPLIASAPAEGARRFGKDSAGWEISEAVKQTLELSVRDHPQNVIRLLDAIEVKARNEIARIDSLETACATAADTERLDRAFAKAGLVVGDKKTVRESSNKVFADFRLLHRG